MRADPARSLGRAPRAIVFGVYPGGGTGETGSSVTPSAGAVLRQLNALRGSAPFRVNLYTAWSWYDPTSLDSEINQYSAAGFQITLTIKYSPPAGHDGDAQGYAGFVTSVVQRYATNPSVYRFVIGNEINLANGNPGASDGPFANVPAAIVRGVHAAENVLGRVGSRAQLGFDLGVGGRDNDAWFTARLAKLGGSAFVSAISFLGLNAYPSLEPDATGDHYTGMATNLINARAILSYAGFSSAVTIDVLENGSPTLDESAQASMLDAYIHAVRDHATSLNISGYSWFALWDADSTSSSIYGHYGLLRSDLTAKPAFARYQRAIADNRGRP